MKSGNSGLCGQKCCVLPHHGGDGLELQIHPFSRVTLKVIKSNCQKSLWEILMSHAVHSEEWKPTASC